MKQTSLSSGDISDNNVFEYVLVMAMHASFSKQNERMRQIARMSSRALALLRGNFTELDGFDTILVPCHTFLLFTLNLLLSIWKFHNFDGIKEHGCGAHYLLYRHFSSRTLTL
jgi:hypothetical protein